MQGSIAGLDPTLLTLAAILGVMGICLGATMAWGVFQVRADRLPAATRLADVRERLALKQVELAQKEARLHELEQKEHERDRLFAEVEVLERRLDESRLEWENLATARDEIGRAKAEAADAASARAKEEHELRTLREEAERIRTDLDPERIAQLRRERDDALRERDSIESELVSLRAERDAAFRAIAEAGAVEARTAALSIDAERVREEMARLSGERDKLASEVTTARGDVDGARRDLENAQEKLKEIAGQMEELRAKVASLETRRDELASELRRVGDRSGEVRGPPTLAQQEAILADLVAMPESLKLPGSLRAAKMTEAEALQEVATYLRNCGLAFSRRTVKAFHTSLKVNDTAQLTVLAGVSGTGKSLLPRRYAEAMGIHFLQVAVEPRWDSPQDLLGFYNYVEQKYRATDLARLLANLDPWQSLTLPDDSPSRKGHMAMVLLDEMNLARVEYYFSEFLSRLEARPGWREDLEPEDCKNAMIPVDIRGLQDPPRLFPGHNVLFVGTMNDDESTQSLSDKVLDRGNILQFPAPREFPVLKQGRGAAARDAQDFTSWRSWVRPTDTSIQPAVAETTRDVTEKLAAIMQGFGRPFGHRLNQAIRAYVANYPSDGNAVRDGKAPLADQIEFRILPKLRGIDIQQHPQQFDQLETLVRTRLDDAPLADELSKIRSEQERASGLFVWRGLARGE